MSIFNKYNFLISNFCSKSEIRPEISGVFVSQKETCATDGFILIKVDSAKADIKKFPAMPDKKVLSNFQSFILPAEKTKEVSKLFRPNKTGRVMPILENAVITKRNEVAEISTFDLTSVNSVMSHTIKGEFPKYNDLMVERGKFLEISVNPKFLKKIAEFYSNFANDKNEVKIKVPFDKTTPVRFEANREGQTAKALLMPIKSNEIEEK